MHLADFKEIVAKGKEIQSIVQISPVNLIGFTMDNQKKILMSIMTGSPLELALDMAKVKVKAWKTWEALAENDVEPFSSFMMEVRAARAYFGMEMIQKMRESKMHIVELWKIHYPETVLAQQVGHGQTVQQNVTVNFLEKDAKERASDLQRHKMEIVDASQIINLEVKDE